MKKKDRFLSELCRSDSILAKCGMNLREDCSCRFFDGRADAMENHIVFEAHFSETGTDVAFFGHSYLFPTFSHAATHLQSRINCRLLCPKFFDTRATFVMIKGGPLELWETMRALSQKGKVQRNGVINTLESIECLRGVYTNKFNFDIVAYDARVALNSISMKDRKMLTLCDQSFATVRILQENNESLIQKFKITFAQCRLDLQNLDKECTLRMKKPEVDQKRHLPWAFLNVDETR